MLTRTLATLTLLLALNGGADPAPRAGAHLDGGAAPRRAHVVDVDDVGGCREAPPVQLPVAPVASCSEEGQP